MAGSSDVVLGQLNGLILTDDEGGADDTVDKFAVILLLPERAPCFHNFFVGIREQGEGKLVLFLEFRELLWKIGGNTDDVNSRVGKHRQIVAEIACFLSASGCVRAGIEVDQHFLARIIRQRHLRLRV